jgi:RNA polymerase sigma-70 factor (ECF subfamily)
VSSEAEAEDDLILIREAAAGNTASFERLMERHQASVHRFVRTLTTDAGAAEDALQETFVAAWRGAARFRGEAPVRSWLFTIARHAVRRQFRRPAGAPSAGEMAPLDDLAVQAGWGCTDPESSAMRREREDVVRRALDSLEPDDRRVLVLRDLEGLSGVETAAVLGLTVAALKSRLHRARLRFAARLRREVLDGV